METDEQCADGAGRPSSYVYIQRALVTGLVPVDDMIQVTEFWGAVRQSSDALIGRAWNRARLHVFVGSRRAWECSWTRGFGGVSWRPHHRV